MTVVSATAPATASVKSKAPSVIRPSLARIGRRLLAATVAHGGLLCLSTLLGAALVLCLLDNLVHLPAGVRLMATTAGLVAAACALALRVGRPLLRRTSEEGTAQAIERHYGRSDNLVINACQFESATLRAEERVFAAQVGVACRAFLADLSLGKLCDVRRLAQWAAATIAATLAWGLYVGFFPLHAGNALHRLLLPLADVPALGRVVITLTPERDLTVFEGSTLTIRAAIAQVDAHARAVSEAPIIAWNEDGERLGESLPVAGEGGQRQAAMASDGKDGRFSHAFAGVRRSFTVRVFCGGACSRALAVTVKPLPALRESTFAVTPPEYAGGKPTERPGPPSELAGLPGSQVALALALSQPVATLTWTINGATVELHQKLGRWIGTTMLTAAGGYELTADGNVIARGSVRLESDRPPTAAIVTDDANRFVNPGTRVELAVEAPDDFGLRSLTLTCREAENQSAVRELKAWRYLGPPGNPGPVKERATIVCDPDSFQPGKAYIVEAVARDFAPPSGQVGTSSPLVLRIRGLNDVAVAAGDPLADGFQLLRQAIAEQQKANGITANCAANLVDVLGKKTVDAQRNAMHGAQAKAQEFGGKACQAFIKLGIKNNDAASFAKALPPLVDGEMGWALTDIGKFTGADFPALANRLAVIGKRQAFILQQLIALLGAVADKSRGDPPKSDAGAKDKPFNAQEAAQDLKDDLDRFAKEQQKILDRSKTLLENGPADLTDKKEEILGELAREEAKMAKYLEEKLNDFSKLPLQDFADGSIAKELNEVYQEVQGASKDLFQKKVELAVPMEQSGLENAKKLENNLEKWLASAPDSTKWQMEDAKNPADVALAELPKELEDIVGDLLDQEDKMDADVEDASSQWMDSADKGAGWDAADGPISNNSAKGVTGNQLPNKDEIGGRSGEGRNGRSSGQMVEETAQGKGGRETPTRMTPSPFEQGSVKDTSTADTGGATGGGKTAGSAGEGLIGPTPPPEADKLKRLAGAQNKIRQEAGELALKLRKYKVSAGDLETAIAGMKDVEDAAKNGNGRALRQRYSQVMDGLKDAKSAIDHQVAVHNERSKLPDRVRKDVFSGTGDKVPQGYEDMVGAYFQALAEQQK